jgi:radical SAM protein with 4Fe4S-binding SPASM domain
VIRVLMFNRRSFYFNRFKDEAYLSSWYDREIDIFTGVATDILHLVNMESVEFDELHRRLNRLLLPRRQTVSRASLDEAIRRFVELGYIENTERSFRTQAIRADADVVEHIVDTWDRPYLYTPDAATIFINGKCNQKCEFCFLDFDKMAHQHQSLSDDDWLRIIDRLLDAGIFFINVGGMEPMLSFDLTAKILRRVKDAGGTYGFITNGSIPVTERQLAILAELSPRIGVSLHGHEAHVHNEAATLPNAYNVCVANIKKWIGAGIRVTVQAVALHSNTADLPGFVRWMDDLGIAAFELQNVFGGPWCETKPFFDVALTPSEYEKAVRTAQAAAESLAIRVDDSLYPHQKDLSKKPQLKGRALQEYSICSAGTTAIYVSPNGDASPCPILVAHDDHRVGNVLHEPVLEVWHRSAAFGPFRASERFQFTSTACQSCEGFTECRGGCLYSANQVRGGYLSGDPRCSRVDAASPAPIPGLVQIGRRARA